MFKKITLLIVLSFLTLATFGSEYIVEMKDGVPLNIGQTIEKIADDIYLIKTNNKFAKTNLNFEYGVKTVERNIHYSIPEVKKDRTKEQWALYGKAGIKAREAWAITEGSEDIVIAVIDTGIDYNHEDLKDNMWTNEAELNGEEGVDDDENGYVDDIYGYNFQKGHGDPMDDHSHGTHCAGVIGAVHNSIGINGVMKNVKLMALKFLGSSGGSSAGAIAAIKYATKMKVNVMSNSWGGGGRSVIMENAIKDAEKAGIVFVAAAGNDGRNNDYGTHYPSNYEVDNVIAVASHTVQDKLSYFSNYGIKNVHVSAPGSDILSTVPDNKYKSYSGTSMATPYVSGVIGLLLSQNPDLKPLEIRKLLMKTSFKGPAYTEKVVSKGRIDAAKALLSL